MTNIEKLNLLLNRFKMNLAYYKDTRNNYNEHSCRIEYIDPLLKLFGWDVANEKGLAPQYREVIAENYSTPTDRPDYTMTLRGVAKFFVEAKKPSVDIIRVTEQLVILPNGTIGLGKKKDCINRCVCGCLPFFQVRYQHSYQNKTTPCGWFCFGF